MMSTAKVLSLALASFLLAKQIRLGADWKKSSARLARPRSEHQHEAEHLAYRQNYVDLDPTYTDKVRRSSHAADARLDGP